MTITQNINRYAVNAKSSLETNFQKWTSCQIYQFQLENGLDQEMQEVHFVAGISRFSMKSIYKRWFLENVGLEYILKEIYSKAGSNT
jgi:hypothetical protein